MVVLFDFWPFTGEEEHSLSLFSKTLLNYLCTFKAFEVPPFLKPPKSLPLFALAVTHRSLLICAPFVSFQSFRIVTIAAIIASSHALLSEHST
jgi:hypothetical protein